MIGSPSVVLPAASSPGDADARAASASANAGPAADHEHSPRPGAGLIDRAMPDEAALIRVPNVAAPGSQGHPRRDVDRRVPRKIRYTAAEWAAIVDRAHACGKAPARYVRETSLGATPRSRRGTRGGGDDRALLAQLARIGGTLNQLARLAHTTGRLPSEAVLRHAVDALLAVVRRAD
jgi:hypothetical protein